MSLYHQPINRPFAPKPSREIMGYNLMNARNGKSMSKISKWPSLVIVTVVVVVVDFIGEGNI